MHNGNTPSSVPTSVPPPILPSAPKVRHGDLQDETEKKLAERQTAPSISPKPAVQRQQNKRATATPPAVHTQQNTQSNPQQQPVEINHSDNNIDEDKVMTKQPTFDLKVDISVPKLSIAIFLLFTSKISAIGCIVATAILYEAPVVPIALIAIFVTSMLVMLTSVVYTVYSIKNALKGDLKEHIESEQPEKWEKTQQKTVHNPLPIPLAPEENQNNGVIAQSRQGPDSGYISGDDNTNNEQLSNPTSLPIANHKPDGTSQLPPPPPPPPISNHSSMPPPPPPPLPPFNGSSKPVSSVDGDNAKGALLLQITGGVKLKKVQRTAKKLEGKDALLAKIRGGVTLRKTGELANLLDQTKSNKKKPNTNKVVDSLQNSRAFQNQSKATRSSDSEDEHSSSDLESDWSDDESDVQSNPQAGPQSSTSAKPPVPKKPIHLQPGSQARSQSSTNAKPPVPEKPIHLQQKPRASAAKEENNSDHVSANMNNTRTPVSFHTGCKKIGG